MKTLIDRALHGVPLLALAFIVTACVDRTPAMTEESALESAGTPLQAARRDHDNNIVPGYEIVTAQVLVPGATPQQVLNAVCPLGKKVTGGGFAMGTGLVIGDSHPAIRPGGDLATFGDAWFVRVANPTADTRLLTVYAICVGRPGA